MKIFLAQQNYHIGNFNSNTAKIISAIEEAKSQSGDLIVFSELCVCGYPSGDFLYFKDFINKCYAAVDEIAAHAVGIAVLIGSPLRNESGKGKDLFNAVLFISEGKVQQVIHKTCLPTYDVFDENRYFEPASSWGIVEYRGVRIAVTVCEDIWNLGNDPLYIHCPMDYLLKESPDVMINLSASPFSYTHEESRKVMVKANAVKYNIPVIYCNAVGSQTGLVFDGNSLVFDKQANLCVELPAFREALQSVLLTDDGLIDHRQPTIKMQIPDRDEIPLIFDEHRNTSHIFDALVMGIRDYFSKMGFDKAIVGSSGGIDSAVTLAIAVEALGAGHVHAVLMPSDYSSTHSVSDAVQLSQTLGNPYDILPIGGVFQSFLSTLKPVFNDLPFGVAEENIQSRSRGNILMAMANKFGYILLNTSNKSELSTGYGTLYGDMAGGLSVLGDCYKQQVYALARYINSKKEIIPQHIIDKAPSAELRPDQKDSDSLPDYAVLDKILYQYIELNRGPDEIKKQGFDTAVVDRVLKLVNTNEYKRNQFCPVIRISPRAFGPGRRMPVVAKYLS